MNNKLRLSLIVMAAMTVGLGFTAGADALPGAKPKAATLQDLKQEAGSPEISAAEVRVEQAKAQVDLANKQVNASRALLKAAQADLKAALAQLDALKLSAHAQGLVETTGMTPAKAPPVSIAAKSENKEPEATTQAPPPAPPLMPSSEESRIKTDTPAPEASSEPIQLR